MPKISKQSCHVSNNTTSTYFSYEIYYDQNHGFYSEIEEQFQSTCGYLTDEEKKELFISQHRKKKTWIVPCQTEQAVTSYMFRSLSKLVDMSAKKRDVIILFFESSEGAKTFDNTRYNKDHELISVDMGITYCTETIVGSIKKYFVYRENDAFGEKRISKTEIDINRDKRAKVIPDTPENRASLETLYAAFDALRIKLKEITESPDTLLSFISSGVALLGTGGKTA